MPQKTRNKSGDIKVSLHAAVLDETYSKLEAAVKRNNKSSLGEIIDDIVEDAITNSGFLKHYKGG